MGTMKTTAVSILAVVALATGFFGPSAHGVTLTGNLTFTGGATFDTDSLATATRIDSFNTTVTSSDGDFAQFVNPSDAVTMAQPWIFSASTPTLGLWNVGGFTFDLASAIVVSQDSMMLALSGTGVVSGHGFSDTSGTWDYVWRWDSSEGVFSFTSDYDAIGVPDGGPTIMLLGLGIAGLAIARRKFVRA